jgi:Ca2+-dependent lipid-binding protein
MPQKTPNRKLDDQIIVRMEKKTKEAFMQKAKSEGKAASVVIMTFIEAYLTEKLPSASDVSKLESEVEFLKTEFHALRSEMVGKSAA